MALFVKGDFTSHAGVPLAWKVECDGLDDEDIQTLAYVISQKRRIKSVHGVPRGGTKLANALTQYITPDGVDLIVDDVLTTGTSMEEKREEIGHHAVGIVIFARGDCPDWVKPIFRLDPEWCF